MQKPQYLWFRLGDINAFFGLMADNMSDIVIMAGILFGIINSPLENGGLFLPWQINSSVPVTLFAGYLSAGLMLNYVGFHNKRFGG